MRLRKTLAAGVVAVAALGLGACGDGEDRPGDVTAESGASGTGTGSASGTGSATAMGHGDEHGDPAVADFSEEEADSVAEVKMTDYAFALPATTKGPKVYFEATNDGAAEHEFLVLDGAGEELGEIEPMKKADGEKSLALDLEPGTYTAVCLVEEGVKTHRDLGMEATFTVE